MALVLRCEKHPGYDGAGVPGAALDLQPAYAGAQSCPDCWEVYRRGHEGEPVGL